jgi:hypothetical protein
MRHALVDGVQVVWDDLPGPFQGALVVGCGAHDEEVDQIGLTALVVEQVLDAVDGDEDGNATDSMASVITASGSPGDVAAFFADCCAALADLPVEDLAALPGSSAGYRDPWASLLAHRFGRSGPGLIRWPAVRSGEFTADQVRAHAARHFTADNTVLALSGPPPDGLRLPLLPGPSVRRADPPETRLRRRWYTDEVDGVGIAISGTDGPAAVILQLVLADRVAAALQRDDLVYRTTPSWTPLGPERVEFGLTLQLEDQYGEPLHAAAAELLWAELQQLVAVGPDREEIAEAVDSEGFLLEEVSDRLFQAGQRELFGASGDGGELAAVSPSDVRSAASSWWSTATIVVPLNTDAGLVGLSRSRCPVSTFMPNGVVLEPLSSSFRRRLRKAGGAERLVLGDDAAALVGAGSVHTFPMADILIVEDGELLMLGNVEHGCLANISAFGGRTMLAERLPPRRYRKAHEDAWY